MPDREEISIPDNIPDPPFVIGGDDTFTTLSDSAFADVIFNLPEVFEQLANNELQDTYRAQIAIMIDQQGSPAYVLAVNHYGASIINALFEAYLITVENTNQDIVESFANDSYVDKFTQDGKKPFGSALELMQTNARIYDEFNKFIRDNTPPPAINAWECRIGASKFLVPPTNVVVQTPYKTGSLTGGVIRQKTSAKFNSGHSETIIDMRLYFPNQDSVWGIGANNQLDLDFNEADDAVVDRFLSSLRGLITQFKYAPFLPIRHHLINSVYDVTGVAMENMSISTIPDYPLCYVVDLRMKAFNHKVYLPPVSDFNEAIHWGKFRQYMGRAAQVLASDIDKGFLVDKTEQTPSSEEREGGPNDPSFQDPEPTVPEFAYEGVGKTTFNRQKELLEGKNLQLYYPRTTPGRIFTADMASFRQQGEDQDVGRRKAAWENFLGGINIDINTNPQAVWDYVSSTESQITSGDFNARSAMMEYLRNLNIATDPSKMTSERLEELMESAITKYKEQTGKAVIPESMEDAIRNGVRDQWFAYMFNSWKNSFYFDEYQEAASKRDGLTTINEWEIPMDEFVIDKDKIVLVGSSVSISNNFASLQLQLQESPTYQHISGGDSQMTFQMRVFGEQALIGFKRVLNHINGLARLENTRGVLGFVGIKHILTALCGIKYGLPMDFSIQSVEDTPGVYDVSLTFTDFDIFQQQREEISVKQQRELVEHFGKRNPFLRIKQLWGAFNAYPDFPLSIRDEEGQVVGHLDPDYYFRAFQTFDDKIVKWNADDADGDGVIDDGDGDGQPDTLEQSLTKYTHQVETFLGIKNNAGTEHQMITLDKDGMSFGSQNITTGTTSYVKEKLTLVEDSASDKHTTSYIEGLTPGSHQQPMLTRDPLQQFQHMMTDAQYRDVAGRMVRAFPTYMLWLIDEGGTFAGVKLFDNFYNMQSVIDFSVHQSEDVLGDTLVLRLSNLYSKLSTRYQGKLHADTETAANLADQGLDTLAGIDSYFVDSYDQPGIATEDGDGLFYLLGNTYRNIVSGTTDSLVEIDRIRLKPGVRVHLRAGYSANPNVLETVFNGTITEVMQGDIVTVTAQSDAIELSPMVNTSNKSGHSGKIDGSLFTQSDGLALWLSEPRDLMIRLLTMGTSTFREMMAYASSNLIFSENKFGIRHFGMMMYKPLSLNEEQKQAVKVEGLEYESAAFFSEQISTAASDAQGAQGSAFSFDAFQGMTGIRPGVARIMNAMWINLNRDPDYEIFKRNIYPGNGLGVAQYLGGDFADGGLAVAVALDEQAGFQDQIVNEGDALETATGGRGDSIYYTNIAQRLQAAGGDSQLAGAILDPQPPEDGDDSSSSVADGVLGAILGPVGGLISDNPEAVASAIGAGAGGGGGSLFGLDNVFASIFSGIVSGGSAVVDFASDPAAVLDSYNIEDTFSRFLGIARGIDDDGGGLLSEFDEVSFRAQTYMKSVWDLFQLCAALLPNYIVAVRPFEDRSTIFYGKPHWLYTSGVIPVTTGVPKDSEVVELVDINTEMAELMEQLAEEANPLKDLEQQLDMYESLGTQAPTQDPNAAAGVTGGPLVGGDNAEKIWHYLIGKGLSPNQAAGVMGNIKVESGFDPGIEEQGTARVDKGFGICQWTFGRRTNLETFAREQGKEVADLGLQLDFLWHELSTISSYKTKVLDKYLADASMSIDAASDLFLRHFEIPANMEGNIPIRRREAAAIYAAMSALPPPPVATGTPGVAAPGAEGEEEEELPDWANGLGVGDPDIAGSGNAPWWDEEVQPNPILYEVFHGHMNFEVPAWIDPESGIYTEGSYSNTGDTARLLYDKAYNEEVFGTPKADNPLEREGGDDSHPGLDPFPILVESGKDKDQAETIWKDFREKWRSMVKMKEAYERVRGIKPERVDTEVTNAGGDVETVNQYMPREYIESGNKFLSILWNDARARAWVIITASKKLDVSQVPTPGGLLDGVTSVAGGLLPGAAGDVVEGIGDAVAGVQDTLLGPLADDGWIDIPFSDPGGSDWTFALVAGLFEVFLNEYNGADGSLQTNEFGIYTLTAGMLEYINANMTPGLLEDDIVAHGINAVENFLERNIGALITSVASTIQGVISLFRMSLMSLGYGLNMAGQMQKQANILNRFYNDSVYYDSAAHEMNSLEYLADNPFTREYGEPVVEVREPFQRVHYVDSFQWIMKNMIQETLNDVPTTITAVSDGSHPVTVHFDKGIPSNLQVERVVETGLFWDNAKGKGFFSALHPLLHPIETARGYTKTITGSSDELMSKRVGLYHLKEGLKDIYGGEIMILGNPDIRPHDLLYIADNYECQPPETKVRVVKQPGTRYLDPIHEDVDIKDLKVGDKVLSIEKKGHIHKRGKEVLGITNRPYKGLLYKATSESGLESKYTPNHRCIVRTSDFLKDKWIVYLMEKNGQYRVGMTRGVSRYGNENILGLTLRMRGERADRGWILSTHDSLKEALVRETIVSNAYGLPQTCFVANGTELDQNDLDEIWKMIMFNGNRAEKCLHDHNLSEFYPFRKSSQNSSVIKTTEVYAINLLDGMKMKNENGEWETISVSTEDYEGDVYSLKVADNETYLADGLFTHNSMFGLVEVEQVVHHFTSDLGFVTSITPNALVTINDPSRWTMMSWLWSWFGVKEFRETVRGMLSTSEATSEFRNGVTIDQLANGMQKSIRGHLQYTQGASALVKDLMGARATGLLQDTQMIRTDAQRAEDMARGASDLLSGVGNTFSLGLAGAATDWAWDAWDWVRENLLDQQGCYIQYLNKNGEPMDAGLSYAQGVAVGRHHKTTLLPGILGLDVETRVDGHTRITVDDLLANLGWNEVDFTEFRQHTSYFIDQVNSQVLELAGQSPGTTPGIMPEVIISSLDSVITDIIDGDTIKLTNGMSIRLEGVAAPELWDKHNLNLNSPDNRGLLATQWLMDHMNQYGTDNLDVAVRVNPNERTDMFGRVLGTIFYRVPPNTKPEDIQSVLTRYAGSWPLIPWDSYMDDGIPYTLNWAIIASGYAAVDTKGLSFSNENMGAVNFQGAR